MNGFNEVGRRESDGVYLLATSPSRLAELLNMSFRRTLAPSEIAEALSLVQGARETTTLCEAGDGEASLGDTRLCREHCLQAIYRES